MKKKILLVIFLICAMLTTSCIFKSKEDFSKEERKEEHKDEILFNMDIGKNIVFNYMDALINEETQTMSNLFSEELKEKEKIVLPKSLKCKSYKLDDVSQVGLKGKFTIKVAFTDMERPLAILENFIIEVSNEDSSYKISKITSTHEKEIFSEGISLRVRNDGDARTYLVIDDSSIPQYAFSKDDKTSNYQVKTPNEVFNSLGINYNGDKLIFSKGDKDVYVGLIYIDYSMPTQGPDSSQTKNQNEGDGGKNQTRETPIGKKIISLDYMMGAQVEYGIFSLEEEFAIIQYNRPSQGRFVKVYDASKGEILDLKLEKKFPIDKVEVVYASLDKEVLNVEIIPRESMDKTDNKILGLWRINLKTKEITKI